MITHHETIELQDDTGACVAELDVELDVSRDGLRSWEHGVTIESIRYRVLGAAPRNEWREVDPNSTHWLHATVARHVASDAVKQRLQEAWDTRV